MLPDLAAWNIGGLKDCHLNSLPGQIHRCSEPARLSANHYYMGHGHYFAPTAALAGRTAVARRLS